MWTTWGVEDESHTVHSLGLSYLTAIGQSLGYVAAAEYPVAGPAVRADCVWWDASSRRVVAVFEFERHKDGAELVEKTRNLMRAWHAAQGTPPLLGLVLWTKNFFPLDGEATRGLWRELEQGFLDDSRSRIGMVPADRLKVFECKADPILSLPARGGGRRGRACRWRATGSGSASCHPSPTVGGRWIL